MYKYICTGFTLASGRSCGLQSSAAPVCPNRAYMREGGGAIVTTKGQLLVVAASPISGLVGKMFGNGGSEISGAYFFSGNYPLPCTLCLHCVKAIFSCASFLYCP